MIRRCAAAIVFVLGFLVVMAEVREFDDANIPDGARYEAKVP